MTSDERTSDVPPATQEDSTTQKATLRNEETKVNSKDIKVKKDTDWINVLFYIYLHLAALYGIALILIEAQWATTILAVVLCCVVPLGVTMGAHRLWAHRSYQASASLRLVLMLLHTVAAQGSIYNWVLEHRFHHERRGTALDPFDPRRGFFFAHLNSKLVKQQPELEEERDKEVRKSVDMSDLEQDAFVMFQKRFYWVLMPILSILLPINAPVEYWGESITVAVCVVGLLRHVVVLNAAWLVHSGPLVWGLQPGENEADSNLVFFVRKSRWPDYHYMLPWDYRTSEYGCYGSDVPSRLIDWAAQFGLTWGLRTCSDETMKEALDLAMDLHLPLRESVERVLSGSQQPDKTE